MEMENTNKFFPYQKHTDGLHFKLYRGKIITNDVSEVVGTKMWGVVIL